MPSFPKPRFPFSYDVEAELGHLRAWRDHEPGRAVPAKAPDRLLIATWNIANLGAQRRRAADYRLLAEVIGWFDIVALQECKDSLTGLRALQSHLPGWRALFSDAGGNQERLAFLYDAGRIQTLEKCGEIAVPPKDHRYIRLPGVTREFRGFDRNPYIGSFEAAGFRFLLVNAHFFFGSHGADDVARRSLEAYAVARWADLRSDDRDRYVADILVLGDLNVPRAEPGDPVYTALRRRGLRRPPHSTRVASSIATDHEYDQIMFIPSHSAADYNGRMGVFDFDGAVFPALWQARTRKQFTGYLRYYLSDHRPLWAQFCTTGTAS